MAMESGTIDYWRKFFRSTNSDIIEVIEYAILVASSDCPKELRSRRDQITEKLYCWVPRCLGCDQVETQIHQVEEVEDDDDDSIKRGGEKESNVGSSSNGEVKELNLMAGSNYSYNEAEALTEEIEEEGQIVGEVLRIKDLLANYQDESDKSLFESLRRLQLMELSVETIKATDIGRAVNGLRKHSSKQIRHLVRALIEDWKILVDEWVRSTAAIVDNSPASLDPSDVDQQEGLPSPPLDEGFLLGTQPTSFQLAEFFDGMDDDGNFRNNVDDWENGRRPDKGHTRQQEPVIKQRKPLEAPNRQEKPQGFGKGDEKRREPVIRQSELLDAPNGQVMPRGSDNKHTTTGSKTSSDRKANTGINAGVQKQSQLPPRDKLSKQNTTDSGPGRPPKLSSERKSSGEVNPGIRRMPPTVVLEKVKNSEDASLRAKLEAAKRKLHENYQQAENAKKQRTIRVMELQDLPKKAHINRHPVQKPKSNLRNWANGRR